MTMSRSPGEPFEQVVAVRERTAADIGGCVTLLRTVYERDRYPAVWLPDAPDWLTPQPLIAAWVADRDEVILGHVALSGVDNSSVHHAMVTHGSIARLAEIKRLFVDPAARRAGIATALLETAARFAAGQGLYPVLEVAAHVPAAVRFYERNGWRRIGTSTAGWTLASGEHPLLYHYEWIDSLPVCPHDGEP